MKLRYLLHFAARWTRQFASVGLLLLCFRLSWITSAQAFQKLAREFQDSAAGSSAGSASKFDPQTAASPGEQKLRDMDKMLDKLKDQEQAPDRDLMEAETPRAELRRLIVDFGPERSAVYVRGRHVGNVPYAGQVHCVLGEMVRVQVLPPTGPPISRDVPCTGKAAKAP